MSAIRRPTGFTFVAGLFLLALTLSGGICKSTVDCLAVQTSDVVYVAHDNVNSTIVAIDRGTGRATSVGPTDMESKGSGMATSRSLVLGPEGRIFPAGTLFGLFENASIGEDWLVTIDPETGRATKVVATERRIAPRGIAFGPNGKLFLLEGSGTLSTINPQTGGVTSVGTLNTGTNNLEWDPNRGEFLAIVNNALIRIDPHDASSSRIGPKEGLANVNSWTISRSSQTEEWFAIDTNTKRVLRIDAANGVIESSIGELGDDATRAIGGSEFVRSD